MYQSKINFGHLSKNDFGLVFDGFMLILIFQNDTLDMALWRVVAQRRVTTACRSLGAMPFSMHRWPPHFVTRSRGANRGDGRERQNDQMTKGPNDQRIKGFNSNI